MSAEGMLSGFCDPSKDHADPCGPKQFSFALVLALLAILWCKIESWPKSVTRVRKLVIYLQILISSKPRPPPMGLRQGKLAAASDLIAGSVFSTNFNLHKSTNTTPSEATITSGTVVPLQAVERNELHITQDISYPLNSKTLEISIISKCLHSRFKTTEQLKQAVGRSKFLAKSSYQLQLVL